MGQKTAGFQFSTGASLVTGLLLRSLGQEIQPSLLPPVDTCLPLPLALTSLLK